MASGIERVNAAHLLQEILGPFGGGGGGSPHRAQGAFPDGGRLDEVLTQARSTLAQALGVQVSALGPDPAVD